METHKGYCPICRSETEFRIEGEWLRDQYFCIECRSIPRQRHLMFILDSLMPDWTTMRLHESSPSSDFVLRRNPHYTWSQFFDGVPSGSKNQDGVLCQNLECLSFPSECLDLFITQDVMEHVMRPDRAIREIMRVLRPGGAHVFTAPRHWWLRSSRPRIWVSQENEVTHLLEPVYHGSPIGDGRALVTWDYGLDFEELLARWADCHTSTYVARDRSMGIDGEYLDVFVSRKW